MATTSRQEQRSGSTAHSRHHLLTMFRTGRPPTWLDRRVGGTRGTEPTWLVWHHNPQPSPSPHLAQQPRQSAQEEQSVLGLLSHGQGEGLLRRGRRRLRGQQQARLGLNRQLQGSLLDCGEGRAGRVMQ